jgi:hypothetical protein
MEYQSATIGKLAEALSKAQAELGPVVKGAKNPFFKSNYAKLSDIIDVIREPLEHHGLAFCQPLREEGENTYLVTKLLHTSGEWIMGEMKLLPTKKDMQGVASAITYAKRYSLVAMVGLAEEDDDGNAASAPQAPAQPQYRAPQAPSVSHSPKPIQPKVQAQHPDDDMPPWVK